VTSFLASVAALLALVAPAPTPVPTGTDLDYQLGGAAEPAEHVGIVVRDRTEEPTPDEEERYDVCYVNGFQTQPDAKRFWRERWSLVLKDEDGDPVVDSAWGEWLLDVRTQRKRERLARIVGGWTADCAADGFEAVEFDNLDSFTRSGGLMMRRDAAAYAELLVEAAHEAGLAAGQKNLAGWDGTSVGFDFAVAEECGRYEECTSYTDVYGDQVLSIEYRAKDFEAACEEVGDLLPVVLRDRDLTPEGVHEWC
jgi:hypothetical protein